MNIDGTESWVFLEFCKKHNCSLLISLGETTLIIALRVILTDCLTFYGKDEEGEWGEIYDNKTGNGILGAVAEKRAEVSESN